MFYKKHTIMKQHILTAIAVAAILTACNSDDMHEAEATSTTTIITTIKKKQMPSFRNALNAAKSGTVG